MSDRRRIAIDLQPIQGYSSRGRGIGRYIVEQVKAIVANHPDRVHSLLVNPHRGIPAEIETFLGPASFVHTLPRHRSSTGHPRTPITSRRRSSLI